MGKEFLQSFALFIRASWFLFVVDVDPRGFYSYTLFSVSRDTSCYHWHITRSMQGERGIGSEPCERHDTYQPVVGIFFHYVPYVRTLLLAFLSQ